MRVVARLNGTGILAVMRLDRFCRAALILVMPLAACRDAPIAEPASAQLVEELRLDANAEDFSAIGRIHVGPHREIVVPLWQDMQVRVYDSTGRRIGALGRRGAGPGEFQSLTAMGWVADTLWIFDHTNDRFTYVGPDGTLLRTAPPPRAFQRGAVTVAGRRGQILRALPFALLTDGRMLVEGFVRFADGAGGARISVEVGPGEALGSLQERPSYQDERWSMTVAGLGREIPFTQGPLFAFTYEGSRFAHLVTEILSGAGGTYTIAMFRGIGDTMFVRTYPFSGTPVPQHARDRALDALLPQPGEATEGPSDLGRRFQEIARDRMPPVYAPVQAMVLGLDETTWLTLRDVGQGRVALGLDARGDVIGRVSLPPRTTLRQATRTHVWVTESDEDGLASVVRYRVALPR